MYRHSSRPRPDWRQKVEKVGLIYPTTTQPDGSEKPYWYEKAFYEFSLDEVTYLEDVTEELHRMCIEAARFMATGEFGLIGLTPAVFPLIRESLEENPVSIYGRFDLNYGHLDRKGNTLPAKLLEYNGDTPTGLVESSIAQWYWLQDVMPNSDQWNSIHERLVKAWRKSGLKTLHLAHANEEVPEGHPDFSGEEWMTVAYMRDTAHEAGISTFDIEMSEIGYLNRKFVDRHNMPIENCFKLYPWEDMLDEEFGIHLMNKAHSTRWIEPMWKMMLSNKALLAALWYLYPNHPNLLPAYLDNPADMTEYVRKPLFGREGDGVEIVSKQEHHLPKTNKWGEEGCAYQAFNALPNFTGIETGEEKPNYAVLGSWVIDGKSAGVGIRESDGLVTDTNARFVPHVISSPTPSETQRLAWLAE